MKKYWLTATSLGAVAALSLTACSSGDGSTESSASPTAAPTSAPSAAPVETGLQQFGSEADVEVLKTINWVEADGQPTLEFETPLTVSDSASLVTSAGDGDVIAEGDNVNLDMVVVSGTDAESVYSSYDNGQPDSYTFTSGVIPAGLFSVVVGNKVGTELIFAELDLTAEVAEGEAPPAVFYAVTIAGVTPPPEVLDDAPDLPKVTSDGESAPEIDFTGAVMPEELVAKTLIEGDGAEVSADQTITANYTGWVWDGEKFDSSWDNGQPLTMPLSNLVPGWGLGLTGQKVGSQVLLVIPPELGYGEQANGAIPANSTLVFVVDIEDVA